MALVFSRLRPEPHRIELRLHHQSPKSRSDLFARLKLVSFHSFGGADGAGTQNSSEPGSPSDNSVPAVRFDVGKQSIDLAALDEQGDPRLAAAANVTDVAFPRHIVWR